MRMVAVALLTMLAQPATGQEAATAMGRPAPVCPRDAEPLPPALAGWNDRRPLAAARDEASLGRAVLAPGIAVDVALVDTAAVHYVARPSHPGDPGSHGGMLTFTVDSPGRYRVAAGSGAWLDVVSGTAALESAGHGHGPNCSGIRKIVDFDLTSGAYVLQISGSADRRITVMIGRAR